MHPPRTASRHAPLALAAILLAFLLAPCRAEAFLYPQMFSREDPLELMRQADAALADKAMQTAVDLYTAAINTGDLDPPEMAAAYERRARAWLMGQRPHQALADLRRSIELAPRRPTAFAWRARAWEALTMEAEALRDADAAVRTCAGCAPALLLRARLRALYGDTPGAGEDRAKAATLPPFPASPGPDNFPE